MQAKETWNFSDPGSLVDRVLAVLMLKNRKYKKKTFIEVGHCCANKKSKIELNYY